MGERYTDSDGVVWEVLQEGGRYVTLINVITHEKQEVSRAELRECFEEDCGFRTDNEAW
jgi:hypothetical protein